jgi:hypothetical protein
MLESLCTRNYLLDTASGVQVFDANLQVFSSASLHHSFEFSL